MSGILYLCATPIGNLEDITFRVIKTLQEVDVIAAEDTRHTLRLLNHFEIKTPMTSYHEFNKYKKAETLVNKLLAGSNIALVTDAGTPGISDPGEELVRQAYAAGITVTSLPGACACVTALTLSGLSTRRFCFEAFLPADRKERAEILEELKTETRTTILYEAPHHLKALLRELQETLGERTLTICKELTKRHEYVLQTTLSKAVQLFEKEEPRGEYVLVLEGVSRQQLQEDARADWLQYSLREHMDMYLAQDMPKKDAMKKVAADRGISKRDVYRMLLEENQ